MNLSQLQKAKLSLEASAKKGTPQESMRARVVNKIRTQIDKLETALVNQADANKELVIAIVGKMNTGKSSLLNAMLFNGEHVLPVAASPMTAGLTIIQYVENEEDQRFEIEYYKKEEWDYIESNYRLVESAFKTIRTEKGATTKAQLEQIFKDECTENEQDSDSLMACYQLVEKQRESFNAKMKIGQPNDVTRFADIKELPGLLKDYVSAKGEYQPVVCAVHIYMHSQLLTFTNESTGMLESYKIVDTPGVNDPVEARDQQAKRFLANAHAAIMLIKSDKCQTQSDYDFLNEHIVSGGMSSILIAFSKLDLRLDIDRNNISDDFYEAMQQIVGFKDGIYKENGQLRRILGIMQAQHLPNAKNLQLDSITTCTLAETIRMKLQKANMDLGQVKLQEEEIKLLKSLQSLYPGEFDEDDDEIADKLDVLAGISRLKEAYLTGKFLQNKDQIVANRYADQNAILSEQIITEIDKQIEDINGRSELLDSITVEELQIQIQAVESLQEDGPQALQDDVKRCVRSLKDDFVREQFNLKLLNKKPQLQDDATTSERVDYKRKGTNTSLFGGNVHNEYVYVEKIAPDTIVRTQNRQIDELVRELQANWRIRLNTEQKNLIAALMQSLQNICNNDTVTIDASLFTSAIKSMVDDCFIGRSTLDIGSWCDEKKRELESYVYEDRYRYFKTNYETTRMSEEEGDRLIKNNASEVVKLFKKNIGDYYAGFYNELRVQVEKECDDINEKLTAFVATSTEKLTKQLQEFLNEKQKIMNASQAAEKDKEDLKKELIAIKAEIISE